jgi:hypothetical protein
MTAGYSGTPVPKKRGIKEGTRVMLLGEPDGFRALLGDLPVLPIFAAPGKS